MSTRERIATLVVLATLLLVGAWSDVSFACEYCMLSQGLSPLQTSTGIGVRIDERYTVLDKLYDGTSKVDNPGAKETFLTTQVTGFYAINENLTALLVVPYAHKTMRDVEVDDSTSPPTETVTTGDSTGLGDIALMGRYIFYKRHALDSTALLAGQLGVKLPTGATDARDDNGDFMDAHIQPGTGSTDFLLGLNGSYALGRSTLSSSILYLIDGQGKAGDDYHQFGNMLNYDVTGLYRIYPATPPGPTVSVALGIAGEWRGDEQLNEAPGSATMVDVGGRGHVMYLNTGLLFIPYPTWIAEFNYRPAIYHNLPLSDEGNQLGEKYKMVVSLTHTF